MRGERANIEAVGVLIMSVLAIAIGWWGLTQFAISEPTGLAALGFACFMLTPAAWLGARTAGAALAGSAGAVMIVIAAVLGAAHPFA